MYDFWSASIPHVCPTHPPTLPSSRHVGWPQKMVTVFIQVIVPTINWLVSVCFLCGYAYLSREMEYRSGNRKFVCMFCVCLCALLLLFDMLLWGWVEFHPHLLILGCC